MQSAAQVRVIDGDTIELNGEDYRLNGIDAPEIGQNCESQSGAWECGKVAANRLLETLNSEEVSCDVHSCHCTLINQNLALNYPIRSVAACILNFHIVPLIIRLYP